MRHLGLVAFTRVPPKYRVTSAMPMWLGWLGRMELACVMHYLLMVFFFCFQEKGLREEKYNDIMVVCICGKENYDC